MHGPKEIVDKNLTKTKFDYGYFAYSYSSSLLLTDIKFSFFSTSKAFNLEFYVLFMTFLPECDK